MPASPSPSEIAPISERSFKQFSRFITSELGIKMPDTKMNMLQSRLRKRIRALGLNSIEQYRDHLFESPDREGELVHFFDAVTTNKTDFFREPHHFKYLVEQALPSLDKRPSSHWNAKVWCAGCSTGEEPYTLAMVLSEYATHRGNFGFSILATDISTQVLEKAKQAIYDEGRIQPVSQELRKRYLLRSRDASQGLIRVSSKLRDRISFGRLNFMDANYNLQDTFDTIFFRNVMIYFDRKTQEQVVNKLALNLRSGGYLFVGHSESLVGLDIPFQQIGSAIYKKR